ncbi:hypothetical protein hairong_108 [Pseudomonas phage hairong]|nr:hypothetical protein hairong_108 [Pseudomonas phage hairong]
MWPFSEIKKLRDALAVANETNRQSVENFRSLNRTCIEQASKIDYLSNWGKDLDRTMLKAVADLEVERMKLVACGIAALSNTRESAAQQRVSKDSPYFCGSVQSVHDAVDREMQLREHLSDALDIIGKVVKTKLQGDMRDNAQEAEKFYNLHRGTKVCVMCGSEMIPLHSEDKKICSNGACGHEVEWKLEEGQKYQHKNNVEPFVEDRSRPEEPRSQTRF